MSLDQLIRQQIPALPFPLNAYAELLRLEVGEVRYLHYGLFASADEPAAEAQERSTRLLLEALGEQPQRILEVGIGLGTTLQRLHELGHQIHGLTPDPAQIVIARERCPAVTLHHSRFEDFSESLRFDTIVFQESCQYVEMNALWRKAASLLEPGGRVLILDEFSTGGPASLPALAHFGEAALRHGFVRDSQLDLSESAAHTLRFLLAAVDRHQAALLQLPGVTPQHLADLQASNRGYQARYAAGEYAYLRLVYRKA
ncbi:cyclopropane-fatty-acyl-phospholipid synthase family protein [Chitinimonas sp.]|uniref:SAM-dependent methyltransferase n=1 Tax=Chitinimonas sp. TaxID=1934313 RepID=UPI0035B1A810